MHQITFQQAARDALAAWTAFAEGSAPGGAASPAPSKKPAVRRGKPSKARGSKRRP
ncbi:MAG: hypothetical protein IT433_02115 [Phycisphaerales bacterium]|nr:hypothetical protein [Phycisphaerales bacterium]